MHCSCFYGFQLVRKEVVNKLYISRYGYDYTTTTVCHIQCTQGNKSMGDVCLEFCPNCTRCGQRIDICMVHC